MIRPASERFFTQGLTIFRTSFNSIKNSTNPSRKKSTTSQGAQINATDKNLVYSPTEGYIRTSPFDPITIPDITLDKYVWQNLHKWENKIAAECITTNRKYTYAQLRDASAALAVRLQNKLSLKPKGIVALCLPNLPEYPICIFGGLEAGQAITTINPAYTADEIARQLTYSGAKLIIGITAGYPILKKACEIAKKNIPIVCIRINNSETVPQGAIDFYQLIDKNGINFSDLKSPETTIDDLAFLPFSSGTTGLPKGVMLTHKNITSNCEQLQTSSPFEPFILETTDTCQEVIPCILPLFHIFGFSVCMTAKIRQGCKLTTLMKFTPDDFIKIIYDYKGTSLNLVPPMVLFLSNSPKVKTEHGKYLRTVICGAAPVGALDVEKFLLKFPHVSFTQGYGLTETSPLVLLTPYGSKKYGAAGLVLSSAEVKVVSLNDDGKFIGLGPNETGELWVRGPQVMKGYLNNEEANRDIFRGTWMRTGDVGYYNEEGYFYITDRMKELIKVKGFQVPPAELEEILRDHPKLMDAAVIGVPHPQCGEVPRAFVVLRPGQKATEKEIQNYIEDKVIHYKRLEGGVTFLDEIPKTAPGKILRKDLKQKYVKN